jgi:hypothetical protein
VPTPTYTALATVTLASAASSVVFSNIPATYRDLILVYNGTVAAGATTGIRFNGDTGSNYNQVQMYGVGSGSGTSTSGSNETALNVGYPGTSRTQIIVQIMDYSATDKHKTTLSRSDNSAVVLAALAGRWASTSAITSITFRNNDGESGLYNYLAGSTFSLYGIVA